MEYAVFFLLDIFNLYSFLNKNNPFSYYRKRSESYMDYGTLSRTAIIIGQTGVD